MESITLTAVVGDDHRVTLELPDSVPVGPIEITIRHHGVAVQDDRLDAATARRKLQAAGLAATRRYATPDALPLSATERMQIGRTFSESGSMTVVIDQDRGAY
jgi:hypothetical protein